MTEIGQSSRVGEEEVFIDIPVDTERLTGYAPVAPAQSESQEDEDTRAEAFEPVWGGVMRFDGGEESDDEDEATEEEPEEGPAETDPEEGPQGAETAEYLDDMGTTADDIIDELTTRNGELEDRVRHLEEQNQTHQQMEDQYRDVAYQQVEEVSNLRGQIAQLQQERAADSHHLTEMGQRLAQAEDRADRYRAERDAVRTELHVLGDELFQTRADRDVFHDAWLMAARRVDVLEREVRERTAQSDLHIFEITTAFGRFRDRVRRYPREEGRSRRWIRRRVVYRIARRERRAAVRRSRQ